MPSINPLNYNEITSLASPGVSAGVDFNTAGLVSPRFEIDLSTPTIIPNNTSPWWPPAEDCHHNTHVHTDDQVNISPQEDFTMLVSGWDISSIITDDIDTSLQYHHGAYNHNTMRSLDLNAFISSDTVSIHTSTYTKCLFCGLMITKFDFICDDCYREVKNDLEALKYHISKMCALDSDVYLKLNIAGLFLKHHDIIDYWSVNDGMEIIFRCGKNGRYFELKHTNRCPHNQYSTPDIVPREMFIID